MRTTIRLVVLMLGFVAANVAADDNSPLVDRAASPQPKAAPQSPPRKQLFSGKVIFLRESLRRRGITAFSEFDKQVVLETSAGELIPIVPNWRGRAFYQDEKLRHRKVDLVGSRRQGVPYLQVLMVFTFDNKGLRQYTDYWCDICSIPMYEIKPCDCCQGSTRLRFQTRGLPAYLTSHQRRPKKPSTAKAVGVDSKQAGPSAADK